MHAGNVGGDTQELPVHRGSLWELHVHTVSRQKDVFEFWTRWTRKHVNVLQVLHSKSMNLIKSKSSKASMY